MNILTFTFTMSEKSHFTFNNGHLLFLLNPFLDETFAVRLELQNTARQSFCETISTVHEACWV